MDKIISWRGKNTTRQNKEHNNNNNNNNEITQHITQQSAMTAAPTKQ